MSDLQKCDITLEAFGQHVDTGGRAGCGPAQSCKVWTRAVMQGASNRTTTHTAYELYHKSSYLCYSPSMAVTGNLPSACMQWHVVPRQGVALPDGAGVLAPCL